MFLLSRHSWFYQSVIAIHSYVRYLITIALLITLVAVWWYGLYSGTRSKVPRIKAEIAISQKKETDLVVARKVIVHIQKEVDALQQKISDYRLANNTQSQQEQLLSILTTAASSGMVLNGYSIDAQKNKDWYVSQQVQTELSGTYDQLLKFFAGIKECQQMIQCDQLQCTVGKSGECMVSAQLRMTVPLRTLNVTREL